MFQTGVNKTSVLELSRLDFVRRKNDLVIIGKAGTGKSHILKAFVIRACEQGLPVRYARCVDLLDDLHAGLADGTYTTHQTLGTTRSTRPGHGVAGTAPGDVLPIARPVDVDADGVHCDAVEDGGSEGGVAEITAPVAQRDVRGDCG